MPGAGLAADRLGIAWASIACSPVPAVDSYRMFIDPLMLQYFDASTTLAELGLPVRPANLLGRISPYLHLIPVTASFAGAQAVASLPEQVRLVGPLVPVRSGGLAPAAAPSRPMVIVATSSNTWQRMGDGARRQQRSLRVAARALAGMDVDAVLIIPPGASTDLLGPPAPNVRRTALLPPDEFDALIETCSAIVSHGGWGTAARALAGGLPLVVIPTSIDQPYVAQRCDELGLGVALDPLTATPSQFRTAVEAVCGDARYRRAALDFAAELRAAAPAETAASLVAALTVQLSVLRG
jgi:UDP:flavonoid glycosyltransferase YjiC (YdhE family)